jgi:hypothetical protein
LDFAVNKSADVLFANLHFAAAGQTIEGKLWFSRGFNGESSCPKL